MRWAGGALAALALIAAAAPARAYVRSTVPDSDICLFWDARDLGWSVARGDAPGLPLADALPAFAASFLTWQDVTCTDLVFHGGAVVESRDVGFDEQGPNDNLLIFRDRRCDDVAPPTDPCWKDGGCANAYDCWDFSDSAIAVTTTTFSQKTGEIVDADIEFNASAFPFTAVDGSPCKPGQVHGCVATDVQNTATHEIGHFLGLDHSTVRVSTMYASAPVGETSKRTLDRDDIEGICAIYPAGAPTSVCVNRIDTSDRHPDQGCSCGAGGGVGPEALLALLPAARWLRRRPVRGMPARR